MGVLSNEMQQIIQEQKIGYVATVSADGTPNLSPKGTFLVLDDDHIMFGEIRSPNTMSNIQVQPIVEINFVDAFSRKGFRFKGPARFHGKETSEFGDHIPLFLETWGSELCELFNGIVVIHVNTAAPLISPAYDIGGEETALRKQWLSYFEDLQRRKIATAM